MKACEENHHMVERTLREIKPPVAVFDCACQTCGLTWKETYMRQVSIRTDCIEVLLPTVQTILLPATT